MDMPDIVNMLNGLAKADVRANYLVDLDSEAMKSYAVSITGLHDFGEPEWEQNYHQFVTQLDRDDLHVVGRLICKANILRTMINKLLFVDELKRNSAISNEEIISPVFIVGNARTGTTMLFELMALDRKFRVALGWEAHCPIYSSSYWDNANTGNEDIKWTNMEALMHLQPGLKAMHELRRDLPVECIQLLMSINFMPAITDALNYDDWIQKLDPHNIYKTHKSLLKLLQHRRSSSFWLLKAPFHMNFLDILLQYYPDARLIHTHRDPAKSVSSYFSMERLISLAYKKSHNPQSINRLLYLLENSSTKVIRQREKNIIKKPQIYDIDFLELVRNPIETIKGAYDYFGIDFEDNMPSAIENYLLNRPRYLHGQHNYKAEDFGMTDEEIRRIFQSYIDFYKIDLEG